MKNKFRVICVLLAVLVTGFVNAQSSSDSVQSVTPENVSNVEKAFISMPDEFYLSLTQEMRVIMIDRYRKGADPVVINKFGGQSRLDSIDMQNGWIRIINSENGIVEIKVLLTDGKVSHIFLIATACAPACSSHTGVFAPDWNFLPVNLCPVLFEDFLDLDKIKADGKTVDVIKALLGIELVQFSFDGDHNSLKVILNSDKELDEETLKKVKPYILTREIHMVWNGSSFVKK